MQPDANTTWFNFTAQSGEFGVYAFSGMEQVCQPYEFAVELVCRSACLDLKSLLGTSACLSIKDRSGGERLVNGLISKMEQLHTANRFTITVPCLCQGSGFWARLRTIASSKICPLWKLSRKS